MQLYILLSLFDYKIFLLFRLRATRRPFIAYDLGITRDVLAYYGCAELFQVSAWLKIDDCNFSTKLHKAYQTSYVVSQSYQGCTH